MAPAIGWTLWAVAGAALVPRARAALSPALGALGDAIARMRPGRIMLAVAALAARAGRAAPRPALVRRATSRCASTRSGPTDRDLDLVSVRAAARPVPATRVGPLSHAPAGLPRQRHRATPGRDRGGSAGALAVGVRARARSCPRRRRAAGGGGGWCSGAAIYLHHADRLQQGVLRAAAGDGGRRHHRAVAGAARAGARSRSRWCWRPGFVLHRSALGPLPLALVTLALWAPRASGSLAKPRRSSALALPVGPLAAMLPRIIRIVDPHRSHALYARRGAPAAGGISAGALPRHAARRSLAT